MIAKNTQEVIKKKTPSRVAVNASTNLQWCKIIVMWQKRILIPEEQNCKHGGVQQRYSHHDFLSNFKHHICNSTNFSFRKRELIDIINSVLRALRQNGRGTP
jgi:hypothetical protein